MNLFKRKENIYVQEPRIVYVFGIVWNSRDHLKICKSVFESMNGIYLLLRYFETLDFH